jgi:cell wall-associated NlpC family hydrolase
MVTPLPGDFALTRISGITGRAIAAGQAIIGDASPVQHALIYVGNGMIVQAMPGGAELISLEEASEPVIWSSGLIPLTDSQRDAMVLEAVALVGTPYSYLDYVSLGLAHFRVRPAWVTDFIADSGHLICSQLVDEVYLRASVQLFDDGRLPGDVTPGDLYKLLRPQRVTSTDRQMWRLANG